MLLGDVELLDGSPALMRCRESAEHFGETARKITTRLQSELLSLAMFAHARRWGNHEACDVSCSGAPAALTPDETWQACDLRVPTFEHAYLGFEPWSQQVHRESASVGSRRIPCGQNCSRECRWCHLSACRGGNVAGNGEGMSEARRVAGPTPLRTCGIVGAASVRAPRGAGRQGVVGVNATVTSKSVRLFALAGGSG